MELILNNIGKLHNETVIRFDGITVLAGENGSGKSTIGKVLYCMFNSLHSLDEKIHRDRMLEIANILMNYRMPGPSLHRSGILSISVAEQLVNLYSEDSSDLMIEKVIRDSGIKLIDEIKFEDLAAEIERVLQIPDEQIRDRMMTHVLQERFDGHIGNVNFPEDDSSIRLIVKGKESAVHILPNGKLDVKQGINLLKDVIYIDDAGTEKLFGRSGWYMSGGDSSGSLRLDADVDKVEEQTASGELLNEKKSTEILSLMEDAGIGEMFRDDESHWVYKSRNLKKPIGIENLSSGTKAFLVLRNLINDSRLDRKGVLILDEPEVHLHPKWQQLYAEIIVLLQKTYELTLLISTHSADFVSFLEYYSQKHGRNEVCHYYLMSNATEGTYATAEEVTGEIDRIYKELSLPYLRVCERLEEGEDQ